jgi:hypothetical protein
MVAKKQNESEDLPDSLSADTVDDEDTRGDTESASPWDPSLIRITTKNFTLREISEQINLDEIDLSPDFQREYVWKHLQRTRLIESILLGIPLPAFYFNQEDDATYQVVDGVQRLSTISLFMNDGHRLIGHDLEYMKELDGLKYSQLNQALMRRFRSTQIVVHIIEPQTPDEVKYDIFNRVNTLGSPLSAQEIRHAMARPRSREFLRKLSEFETFDQATGQYFYRKGPERSSENIRDTGRMMNRELVLRFCAFLDFDSDLYRQYSSLDAYLAEFTKRIDARSNKLPNFGDLDLDQIAQKFNLAMTNAKNVLGDLAFRRYSKSTPNKKPINRAVFEAQATALAFFSLDQVLAKKEVIKEVLLSLFDDEEYLRSITVGTGDPRRVTYRISKTRDALAEIMK